MLIHSMSDHILFDSPGSEHVRHLFLTQLLCRLDDILAIIAVANTVSSALVGSSAWKTQQAVY